MKTKIFWLAVLFAFLTLILNVQSALAHESITVGDYTLEVGWLNEPPVVGQHNAIVVHVTTSDGQPVEDISALIVTISYGGQDRTLTLEPVDEHSPGQFMAPVVPTVPGQYTVQFGGRLGETTFVDIFLEPEEVQPTDTLAFPNIDSAGSEAFSLGMTEWLAIGGLVTGLAGLLVSLLNATRSR